MSDLVATERDTYEEMWGVAAYSAVSPGEQFAKLFDGLVRERCDGLGTVLDAGCGSGKGAVVLAALGYHVTLCDLTPAGLIPAARELPFFETTLWRSLGRVGAPFYDWVYCCDVLEHLPTAFVGLAVARLLDVARKGVFLSVALGPDNLGAWVGRPLHLTVEAFPWWRDTLNELGKVVDARDLLKEGLFLVEPR